MFAWRLSCLCVDWSLLWLRELGYVITDVFLLYSLLPCPLPLNSLPSTPPLTLNLPGGTTKPLKAAKAADKGEQTPEEKAFAEKKKVEEKALKEAAKKMKK